MRNANLVVKVSILCGSLAASSLAASPKTPLMGWASWNKFALDNTADLIKGQADAMVSSGLLVARSEGSFLSIRNLKSGTYSLKAISTEGFQISSFAKL